MELDIKVAKTDYESHLFYEKVKGLENLGEGVSAVNNAYH